MSLDAHQKTRWLREFQLNGFVVLRGFLSVDLVRKMHDVTLLLEPERARAEADGWRRGRARGRLALHLDSYVKLPLGGLADERYSHNPIVEEMVDAIIGAGAWRRGWTLVEAVWKGAEFMDWHSDQRLKDSPSPDAPNRTVRVTYNIPLIPFTWETGSMEVLPGSHHLPRNWGNVHGIENLYAHRLRLQPGDAVLRDGNILHRGTPNLTDHVRPMLDQTYKKMVE